MNLLPFVTLILIILGLFSLSQFQGIVAQKKENQIYLAYFKGLRETRNKKEKDAYKQTRAGKNKNQQNEPSKNIKKQKTYFREKRVGWEMGKLNLSTLTKEPHKYSTLETVASEYVKQLYGHAEFFQRRKDFSKELIQALIEAYKKEDSMTPFHEIIFKDPELQEIFYKMVRGTHTYDLEKNVGYPPFGEMFTFKQSDRPPMNYHYANQSFLSVYFGKNFTKAFVALEKEALEKEKKKCVSPIKKLQLEQMVGNQVMGNSNQIFELLDFKYQTSKKKSAKYKDETTQITVKVH